MRTVFTIIFVSQQMSTMCEQITTPSRQMRRYAIVSSLCFFLSLSVSLPHPVVLVAVRDLLANNHTERGILSVARFCHVFPCELRGPAWAVDSYSISQSAGGTSRKIIFKTLRQVECPALYWVFLLDEVIVLLTYK